MDEQRHTVGRIEVRSPAEFSSGTRQTPGSLRMAAVASETGIAAAMWAGMFTVEPGAQTAIHHHGSQETVVYVIEGEALVRWGEGGKHETVARAGDFLHVPAWVVHREINPSLTQAFRWVVVRSSPEPVVINLPADTWERS